MLKSGKGKHPRDNFVLLRVFSWTWVSALARMITHTRPHSGSRRIWMTVSHSEQQNLLLLLAYPACPQCIPPSFPSFTLPASCCFGGCFWQRRFAVAATRLSQTAACFHIHTRTCLASVCEPLLRRQAWVERPLGSGSRYCRAVRWSILDHCISTEQ